jgi:putative spermidine/putrescine transport system ATP-binding protein
VTRNIMLFPGGNAGDITRPGCTVTIRAIAKSYGSSVPALDGVSLDIRRGEFVTLLGASGSGKTTTLMIVAGFTPPDAGDVLLDGHSIISLPPERRGIGVVFQNYALFPHMPAVRNVAFPLRMRAVPRSKALARAEAALERVGLGGFGSRLPSQLSGGQQQRVALARALVFEPGLLLMDEPLGALDRALREQMKAEIRRLHRELGITIVYVTHDQEEALTLSDRIALMHRGRIVQIGTPADLYDRPTNAFVAGFIGESSLVEGTVAHFGRTEHALLPTGGGPPLRARASHLPEGARAMLLLRPERVAVHTDTPGGSGQSAEIVDSVYVGDVTRLTLRLQGGAALNVKYLNRTGVASLAPGMRVHVTWDPHDAILLPAEGSR